MKEKNINPIFLHVISLVLAVILAVVCSFVLLFYLNKSYKIKTETITGKQHMSRYYMANCSKNVQEEIELAGSLKNKNCITLFGSSELGNELPYSPYYIF